MSCVDVAKPDCPLTPQQVQYLDSQLDMLLYQHNGSMEMRRLVWISGLNICNYIMQAEES
jgi:hypothetical protein